MSFFDVVLWMLLAATLVLGHQAAWRMGGNARTALLVADIAATALVAIPASSVRVWQRVAQEDGVIEWATTFAFVVAGVLSLRTLLARRTRAPALETVVRALLVLFCFGVAGEEISWGQRLFSFQPPELFLEKNFQQELNLHNVLMNESSGLGFQVDSKHLVAAIALAFGAIGPALVRWRRIPRLSEALATIAPPAALAPLFFAVVVAALTYPVDLTGEGAELLLGLLFAITAALLQPATSARAIVVAAAAPLLLGALVAPLLARVVFGDDQEGSARARVELLLLAEDVRTGTRPKLSTRSSIHKRVFTAVQDGYLDVTGKSFHERRRDRKDRVGYFLDPWNNPYWVVVERKEKRAAVYSFGPNRQRDSDPRDPDAPIGDDVVVRIPLQLPPPRKDDD